MNETQNLLVKNLVEENCGDIDTSLEFEYTIDMSNIDLRYFVAPVVSDNALEYDRILSVIMPNLDRKNTSITFKAGIIIPMYVRNFDSRVTLDEIKTINRWQQDSISLDTFLLKKCIRALNAEYSAENCDFQVSFIDTMKHPEAQVSSYFDDCTMPNIFDDDLKCKFMKFEFSIGFAGLTEDLLAIEVDKVKDFLMPINELYENEFINYKAVQEFFELYGTNHFGKTSIVDNFKTHLGVKSDWLYQQQKSFRA